jgi:hypothetical protein
MFGCPSRDARSEDGPKMARCFGNAEALGRPLAPGGFNALAPCQAAGVRRRGARPVASDGAPRSSEISASSTIQIGSSHSRRLIAPVGTEDTIRRAVRAGKPVEVR